MDAAALGGGARNVADHVAFVSAGGDAWPTARARTTKRRAGRPRPLLHRNRARDALAHLAVFNLFRAPFRRHRVARLSGRRTPPWHSRRGISGRGISARHSSGTSWSAKV